MCVQRKRQNVSVGGGAAGVVGAGTGCGGAAVGPFAPGVASEFAFGAGDGAGAAGRGGETSSGA